MTIDLKMQVKRIEWLKKSYRKLARFVNDIKSKGAIKYLDKKYGYIAELDYEIRLGQQKTKSNYPVWVFWWQGKDNMPELVKMCYYNLHKNANDNIINLITKDNYKEFVEIPDYIIEKIEKQISLTHFSDILRFALVNKFGGLWVDATIFVTNSLPNLSNISFFTNKWKNMPHPHWTGYCFYSNANTVFTNTILKMFFEYWKLEKKLHYFFMIDLFILISIRRNKNITDMIDSVPISPISTHVLFPALNKEFNQTNFNEICSKSHFQKLTYKDIFYKHTKDGKLTYYGYLMQEYKKEKINE